MEAVFLWEKLVIGAAIVSIVGSTLVCVFAFKWILETYFPKKV